MRSSAKGNKVMLFLLLYLLVSQVIIAIALDAAGIELDALAVMALAQVAGLFVPFLFYLRITRQKLPEVLQLAPLSPGNALVVTLITIGIIPMVHLVNFLASLVFYPMVLGTLRNMGLASAPLWVSLLVIGVLPSLFEELWFRGALYREYEEVSIRKRAIITGLFFGIMHINFHQFLYAGLFGILYAYILYYTRSIFAPMLMHFVNNSLSVIMFRSASFTSGYFELWGNPALFLLVAGGLSAAMFPVLVILLKKLSASHARHALSAPPPEPEAAAAGKPKVFTWAFWLVLAVFALSAGFAEVTLRAR
ncbi:MAG: CPBP family glutamic-type intramembrane protease [Treponema sp.]|nr:CPBP family glutamic-type intramembrane protease [Treponema sp.]